MGIVSASDNSTSDLDFSDNIDVILHDYAFGIIMYIITAVACGAQYVRENKLKSRAVRLM